MACDSSLAKSQREFRLLQGQAKEMRRKETLRENDLFSQNINEKVLGRLKRKEKTGWYGEVSPCR